MNGSHYYCPTVFDKPESEISCHQTSTFSASARIVLAVALGLANQIILIEMENHKKEMHISENSEHLNLKPWKIKSEIINHLYYFSKLVKKQTTKRWEKKRDFVSSSELQQ